MIPFCVHKKNFHK